MTRTRCRPERAARACDADAPSLRRRAQVRLASIAENSFKRGRAHRRVLQPAAGGARQAAGRQAGRLAARRQGGTHPRSPEQHIFGSAVKVASWPVLREQVGCAVCSTSACTRASRRAACCSTCHLCSLCGALGSGKGAAGALGPAARAPEARVRTPHGGASAPAARRRVVCGQLCGAPMSRPASGGVRARAGRVPGREDALPAGPAARAARPERDSGAGRALRRGRPHRRRQVLAHQHALPAAGAPGDPG